MYVPPAFKDDDTSSLRAMIRQSRLANLITTTASGLMATPLPLATLHRQLLLGWLRLYW